MATTSEAQPEPHKNRAIDVEEELAVHLTGMLFENPYALDYRRLNLK